VSRARVFAVAVTAIAGCITVVAVRTAGVEMPDHPGILVSRQLMESRQLHVGDVVRLSADSSGVRSQPFRILGAYEPTPDPMRFAQRPLEARLHLPDLLALTTPAADPNASDTISSINVALVDPSDAEAFARDLAARLPATVARPTRAPNERTSTFIVIERFHLAVAIVTIIGSAVFLLALMLMLVDERREMVGALRLVGFTRGRILLQVFVEGAIITTAGAAIGLLFALAMEDVFNRFFQWRYDTALIFLRITPGVIVQSALLALPLGIAASLIASWTLLRLHPLELIRR
jgi:putative ABC transport system permease protein